MYKTRKVQLQLFWKYWIEDPNVLFWTAVSPSRKYARLETMALVIVVRMLLYKMYEYGDELPTKSRIY